MSTSCDNAKEKEVLDILQLPKAELHVHLENTVTPERARALASKHGISLPAGCFDDGRYCYADFPDFLELTRIVGTCLRGEDDYYEVTRDYLAAAARSGVIYQEMIFWPDLPRQNGFAPEAALDAVEAAMADSLASGGPHSILQIVLVRHNGVEACEAVARWAAGLSRPIVRAVNLAGNEVTHPPAQFAKAFSIARDAGLGVVIHAGEATGPQSVRDALLIPGVKRIGHGVRAAEDAGLVRELADRNITLEVCPSSNLALRFYDDFSDHPLRRLHDAGVKVTLNSDDPPFFATTIGAEYEIAADRFGFTPTELLGLTRNAINAGFLHQNERDLLLSALPLSERSSAKVTTDGNANSI